jgi:Transposase
LRDFHDSDFRAKQADGTIFGEGFVPAHEDGLARLVIELGPEARACLEMMSGAVWVRDRLAGAGWQVEVAGARKVKSVAPLACKTDKVDARVLAELCRRELVPALWIPSLEERAMRERLKRRLHLMRLRTSAKNRVLPPPLGWMRPRSSQMTALRSISKACAGGCAARRAFEPWGRPVEHFSTDKVSDSIAVASSKRVRRFLAATRRSRQPDQLPPHRRT